MTSANRRRTYAWTAAIVLAAGCGALPPRTESPPPAVVSADSAVQPLLEPAARLVMASPAISRIWPGFWPPGQPFGIANPHKVVLVVSEVAPESLFTALPPRVLPRALRGRAYVAYGEVPRLNSARGIGFDLRTRLMGPEMTVLPVRDEVESTVEVLVHESFHAFQLRAFARPERQDDAFDRASAARPEFASLVESERRLLVAALDAPGRDSLERVVRSYLAVRARRYASTAESVRAEELHLERIEGSAQYVGSIVAALGDGRRRPEPIAAAVREHLTTEIDASDPGWAIRVRSYGTGAAIAILLDRLNVSDWKQRLQAGETFHDLLSRALAER
ncbi:hypothetical protein [Longimicrobium sp.]|uniref:hypothetical protein n=1 Tax=Longimicrobium sp. TaxID=2029185 RepID=UPI003B3B4807